MCAGSINSADGKSQLNDQGNATANGAPFITYSQMTAVNTQFLLQIPGSGLLP